MRRALKIILILFASLLLLLIAAVSTALWIVFTPEKLTPVIRNEVGKYINCQANIGQVELTFFNTFPHFGIKINQLEIVNPVEGTPNDTLFRADQLTGIIDLEAWYNRDEIRIEELILSKGAIHIFTDSLGKVNYDILSPTAEDTTDSAGMAAGLENIRFENVDFTYTDQSAATVVLVENLTGSLTGTYKAGILNSRIVVDKGTVTVEYNTEKYLDRVAAKLSLRSEITVEPVKMVIRESSGTLNGFPVEATGSFDIDSITDDIAFDLKFSLASSPVNKLLKMTPPSYRSYLEGMDSKGLLALEGTMKGISSNSTMPLFDLQLILKNGTLKYKGFPLTLSGINAAVNICTDGLNDSITSVHILRLSASTGESQFRVEGTVDHLFSDIRCDLMTEADLTLSEFSPLIPDSLKVGLSGNARGQIRSRFTLDQAEKMQIDRMILSGEVILSGFDATYDSLAFRTDTARVRFELPNTRATREAVRFMHLDIVADNFSANKINSYNASLSGAHLTVESSNIMKSAVIPDLVCNLAVDSLWGGMDTLSLALKNAAGKVMVSPREDYPGQPSIRLNGKTDNLQACMGKESVSVRKFDVDTEVLNYKGEKDILLQWLAMGSAALEQGNIVMKDLDPVEIPSIKIDFSPEMLNIRESRLIIGKSDFALTGTLKNMLSWYRKDSILRGDLNFTSNHTDLLELMTMTSGIGYEEEKPDSLYSVEESGPYMVPKGMDISLHTQVKEATFGNDTASRIHGNLRVYDGILLLDEMKLTTPAASMLITAMYRTPRKNHLFLGLDFHLLDIEIGHLLEMLPDIDTIMPMLRSFNGKGEFHIAIETYLDSLYRLKMSTLRGAASVKGQDLVLMDGETFSEIAKTLKFNKKTENRVDSLSAEFTIFRNEIDIFPFLIVMDKYKAIIAGRHNLDMSFDYHISVVDCPLPIRLGVNVNGTMDDLSYKLAPCKYSALYRPSSRKVVENKLLEIRKMIREALLGMMKGE